MAAFTMIGRAWGGQAEARPSCQEYLQLRNVTTEAWKEAMRASPSERCGALYQASSAAELTLKCADNNRESCDISVQLLNQLDGYTVTRSRLATMFVPDVLFDLIR
jgi:hypothetical protein